MSEESKIVISKEPAYGVYNASWQKGEKELKAEGKSEIEALKSLIVEIDNALEVERTSQIEDITKDKKTQEAAVGQAYQINDLMVGKWFRVDELSKKLGGRISDSEIMQSLETLQMFELIQVKRNPNKSGDLKFKVTLTNDSRIQVFEQQIQVHQTAISDLESEISELKGNPIIDTEQS